MPVKPHSAEIRPFSEPRARSSPPPPLTMFIGVDSNRQPIETAYTGKLSGRGQRYPNYLPELRAKRVETLKENLFKDKLMERLAMQRQAEEAALNKIVVQNTQRHGPASHFPAPPPTATEAKRRPATAGTSAPKPQTVKKPFHVGGTATVMSLFRAAPGAFSDSASRVLQTDLARFHPKPRLTRVQKLAPSTQSSSTASTFSENVAKRKERKR